MANSNFRTIRADYIDGVNTPRNYFKNSLGLQGTTGWTTYADAAGTQPIDGSGGVPNVVWEISSSSPLRGDTSFVFTKDAANRQGEGVSYSFDIDSADQGKQQQITFDYSIVSGTYVTGDLTVYVIHDPNGTPKIIQPSAFQIENVGVNSTARLTFQTEVSAQLDYMLCFHVASTSASAYTVKLDNVQLGPQVVPMGAPVTDPVAYTPLLTSSGGGSITLNATGKTDPNGFWVREGAYLSGQITLRNGSGGAASGTAGSVRLSIPSGLVMDTARMATSVGGIRIDGDGDVGTTTFTSTNLFADTTTTFVIMPTAGTTYLQLSSIVANYIIVVRFKVPIVGWSSSTVVSSSADTRAVNMVARNYSNGTLASGASHTVILNTVATDTHGAYNSATGEYTVKVPGNYSINGEIGMAATAAAATRQLFLYIRVNGTGISNTYTYANTTSSITHRAQARVNWYCNAGDVITLVAENDLGATGTPQTGTGNSNLSINLIQGPSQIAASEVIAARYSTAAAQSISTGTTTIIDYGTKSYDTHGSVTTGASWKFTAQAPGKYGVKAAAILASSGAWAAGEDCFLALFKNGAQVSYLDYEASESATTRLRFLNGSDEIELITGDYIDVRIQQGSGATIALGNFATGNYIAISRLGGVM